MPTPKPTLASFSAAGAILDALADPKIAMTNDQIKQAWALLKTRHTNNTAAAASNFVLLMIQSSSARADFAQARSAPCLP